ncbi:MAG: ABC transporter ATP-binding protein [Actinomycetota bacterium]|nr:ABC transporter ATP-binding protein [Actinomycetota bacterium]
MSNQEGTSLQGVSEQNNADSSIELSTGESPLLIARDIHKSYRTSRRHNTDVKALRGVNIELSVGKVVALVGESGSGKSTIARILAGQEAPTSGDILFDGQVANFRGSKNYRDYKSKVQMVFQDPFASLNPIHTIAYHLSRPLAIHGSEKPSHEAMEELCEMVRLVPPSRFLSKYPHELSGGQRQRAAIARALAARPRVLLADEPVSMLDVSIRLEVLNLLDSLRSKFSLAMLYITHDIASARYFADEILVMYKGVIVEKGGAEEVTQSPKHPYTKLLIDSSPDPDDLGSNLRSARVIDARVPVSSGTPDQGCRFAPRCPLAMDRCQREDPSLLSISSSRRIACWAVTTSESGEDSVLAEGGAGGSFRG